MGNRIFGNIWGRGEHAKDGFCVGESDWFSLGSEGLAPTWPCTNKAASCYDRREVNSIREL